MPKDTFERFERDRHLRDNPLVSHLTPFETSLVENGYANSTVKSKLCLLASFGHWLERRRLSITDFDEQLVARFIAYKRRNGRVYRGNRETLLQFLDHLRSRDVAFEEPAHALHCQRILAMPTKRHERRPIEFLNRNEIDALLGSADLTTWIGAAIGPCFCSPCRRAFGSLS